MTSRPATPESSPPLEFDHGAYMTDRRITKIQRRQDDRRAIELAQTEIKGHMRVEDELKAAFDGLLEAAKVRTAIIDSQQARIAGLEFDAAIDAALKDRA